MKTIVVYKSKYGYTKRYAEWIAEELSCDIKENAAFSDISGYDMIICGGGCYAGTINGSKLITKNLARLSGKKLILFAVGSSSGADKDIIPFWEKNLTVEQRQAVAHFYLRGGFDYSRLGSTDKLLMNMLKSHLKKIKDPDEETRGLLAAYDTPVDFTDNKRLKELLEYARNA
ncbi:MAG: flavodoxin [Oscillospiraceae bacterium]|nr:flavodoxin [Oscillospiraceae bacterium]